jgi:hypothetical protein
LAACADLGTAIAPVGASLPIYHGFRDLPPPVIVVGMHRSGTSMVAGMLSILGVYMDPLLSSGTDGALPTAVARSNGYGEAVAFRLVNEAVIARSGASWNHVEPFLERRDQARFAAGNVARLQLATFTSLRQDYLDRHPGEGLRRWGWKDPRNSLTLPYWLKLFPNARILHVRRDPTDISESLDRREYGATRKLSSPPKVIDRIRRAIVRPGAAIRALARRGGALRQPGEPSPARQSWHELTDRYVSECERYRGHPGGYVEMWYEEILADPIRKASELADFSCAGVRLAEILKAADFVVSDRPAR